MDRRKLPCILSNVRSALSSLDSNNNNNTNVTSKTNNSSYKAEHIVAALSAYCEIVVRSLADHVKALVPSDLYENLLHNSEIVDLEKITSKKDHSSNNSSSTPTSAVDGINTNEIHNQEMENNTVEEEKCTATRHLLRLIEAECLPDHEADKITNKIDIDEVESNHDDNTIAMSAADEHSHSRSDEMSDYEYPSSNWCNEPSPMTQWGNSRSSYSFHTTRSNPENVKYSTDHFSPHKDMVWVDNTTTMVMDVLRKVANHASSLDRKASKYAILNASPRRSGTTSGVCSAERVCGSSSPISLHPPQLGWFNSGVAANNSINTTINNNNISSNNNQDRHHVFNLDFSVTELQSVADSPIHGPSSFQIASSSAESPMMMASVATVPASTHHHNPNHRHSSNSNNNNNLLESAEFTRSHNIHSPASLIPLVASTPTFHVPHAKEEFSNKTLTPNNNNNNNSTTTKTVSLQESNSAGAVKGMQSSMLSWSVDAEKNALPDTFQSNDNDDTIINNCRVNNAECILPHEGASEEKLALHLAQPPSPPLISSSTN